MVNNGLHRHRRSGSNTCGSRLISSMVKAAILPILLAMVIDSNTLLASVLFVSAKQDPPSSVPSNVPSMMPSVLPSATPSVLPSAMPSELPSAMPSDGSTSSPSVVGKGKEKGGNGDKSKKSKKKKTSKKGSAAPTSSFVPTVEPSLEPTGKGKKDGKGKDGNKKAKPKGPSKKGSSGAPSAVPSFMPIAPSGTPSVSVEPSAVPSSVPSVSVEPSAMPSTDDLCCRRLARDENLTSNDHIDDDDLKEDPRDLGCRCV